MGSDVDRREVSGAVTGWGRQDALLCSASCSVFVPLVKRARAAGPFRSWVCVRAGELRRTAGRPRAGAPHAEWRGRSGWRACGGEWDRSRVAARLAPPAPQTPPRGLCPLWPTSRRARSRLPRCAGPPSATRHAARPAGPPCWRTLPPARCSHAPSSAAAPLWPRRSRHVEHTLHRRSGDRLR